MANLTLLVNGKQHAVDVAPEMPLLWVLRDTLGLTGTKFGCGASLCGACTVLLDEEAIRSCQLPVQQAVGHRITTIEGLAERGDHPVLRAWVEDEVPQCGYCQPGQIVEAVALLAKHPDPTDDQIDAAMDGVLCRCGTYNRIRRAIHRAAKGGAR
ncbi:MAG TPA: (2Fe-2S)-binding protein [Anaeromyxobacteraceae bacterium]|nr:(2Fe-2S)-binding protein [Anaeromyxobacteraceae bacterium]